VDNSAKPTSNTTVGIWRHRNGGYDLVNESLVTLPRMNLYPSLDFVCQKYEVQPVEVREGDVVGAIVTSFSTSPNVVGIDEDAELWTTPLELTKQGYSVSHVNLTRRKGCGLYIEGFSGNFMRLILVCITLLVLQFLTVWQT